MAYCKGTGCKCGIFMLPYASYWLNGIVYFERCFRREVISLDLLETIPPYPLVQAYL